MLLSWRIVSIKSSRSRYKIQYDVCRNVWWKAHSTTTQTQPSPSSLSWNVALCWRESYIQYSTVLPDSLVQYILYLIFQWSSIEVYIHTYIHTVLDCGIITMMIINADNVGCLIKTDTSVNPKHICYPCHTTITPSPTSRCPMIFLPP